MTDVCADARDPLPWAVDAAERLEREDHARSLVGQRIASVRYFEIDYRRIADAAPDEVTTGGRLVDSPDEWDEPSWRSETFDSVDYGVELVTTEHRTFAAIWEMAGFNEGVTFREEELRPKRLVADGGFAIWEVQARSRWSSFIGLPVADVQLLWDRPEPSAALCCFAVELIFSRDFIVLTLGEERDGRLSYQPDNIAVVFGEAAARAHRVGRFAG